MPADSPTADAFEHAALIYDSPDALREGARRFAAEAVRDDVALLVFVPEVSRGTVTGAIDAAGARATMLAAEDGAANPARLTSTLGDWLAEQGGYGRAIVQAIWPGRPRDEVAEQLRQEALLNRALADAPARVLCPFDGRGLEAAVLDGIRRTHPLLTDVTGALRPSLTYADPLEFAADAQWPLSAPPASAVEIPFDGDLWALRRTLADEDHLVALDPRRREDLVFAVNEAAANAIRHGDGSCRTRVWAEPDRVVAEVGTSTVIGDPLVGLRRPDPDATSGRGLWLINQLCDLVELRDGPDGAIVRMHVSLAG